MLAIEDQGMNRFSRWPIVVFNVDPPFLLLSAMSQQICSVTHFCQRMQLGYIDPNFLRAAAATSPMIALGRFSQCRLTVGDARKGAGTDGEWSLPWSVQRGKSPLWSQTDRLPGGAGGVANDDPVSGDERGGRNLPFSG